MLSLAVRFQARRSFVSSVLLTRSWENESLQTLRQEAKHRGLSSKGNKTSLIQRIQEHETRSLAASPNPVKSRPVHVSAPVAASHVPHIVDGAAPGVPPAPETSNASVQSSGDFLNVIIPDVSQPDPEPPVRVPYLPDLWESDKVSENKDLGAEPVLPKLLVVAGADAEAASGISHNLLDTDSSLSPPSEVSASVASSPPLNPAEKGIFQDIADDLGLPSLQSIKGSFSKLFS